MLCAVTQQDQGRAAAWEGGGSSTGLSSRGHPVPRLRGEAAPQDQEPVLIGCEVTRGGLDYRSCARPWAILSLFPLSHLRQIADLGLAGTWLGVMAVVKGTVEKQ